MSYSVPTGIVSGHQLDLGKINRTAVAILGKGEGSSVITQQTHHQEPHFPQSKTLAKVPLSGHCEALQEPTALAVLKQ